MGERQAKALATALRLGPAVAIVSSPLQRATETVAVLNRRFDVVNGLEEFDFGRAAPDAAEMIEERADLTLWRAGDGFPGAEQTGH